MKFNSNIYILFVFLLMGGQIYSQKQIGNVTIYDSSIYKTDEVLTIAFCAKVSPKAVNKNQTLVLAPEIIKGTYSWSLPPIIVQGKKARIAAQREKTIPGNEILFENAYYAQNEEIVNYKVTIPYQEWMEGSMLNMEALLSGCCSHSVLATKVIAEKL